MVGAGDLIWLGTEKKAKKILFLHLIMASSLVIFALSFYWKNNILTNINISLLILSAIRELVIHCYYGTEEKENKYGLIVK